MLRVAFKSLVGHKIRAIFLGLCVVVGVSFVSGTYVLTDTILRTFNGIFTDVYSKIDLEVRSRSELGMDVARLPFDEAALAKVRAVDGVAEAYGGVFAVGAEIIGKDGDRVGNVQAPAFGLEWHPDTTMSPLEVRQGRIPSGPTEVAIDAQSFKDSGYALGDEVTIITPDGERKFTLVGVAGFGRADNIAGATLAMFDIETAQQVMHRVGQFDSISVKAANGISHDLLQERIAAVLPANLEVVTSETLTSDSQQSLKDNLQFFNVFMLTFAYIALFVGAFIIYNTFSIVVSQRTREMALLRAIGATGRQVLASVVLEALVIGFAASLAGLGAGVLMAKGLEALLSSFGFGVPSGGSVVLGRTVAVALIGGTAVTVVSALAPAVRASRVPPIAAMHEMRTTSFAATVRRNIVGAAGVLLGIALTLSGLSGDGLWRVGLGAGLLFLGVAMLAPVIARPVAGLLGAPLRRTRGVAGLLARQNAMRSSRRTASTASALMIGTALLAASLVLSSSLTKSVDSAVEKGAIAPLVIRSDSFLGISNSIRPEAAKVPGVAAAYSLRNAPFKLGNADKILTAIDPQGVDPQSPTAVLELDVKDGDINALATGGMAVSTKAAEDHGWSLGSQLDVTYASGARTVPIVATFEERQLAGDYVISTTEFDANYAEQADLLVLISAVAGTDVKQLQQKLKDEVAANYPGVKVQDKDEYIGDVRKQINQFLNLITALLTLAIVIAVFGVLIAMLLAVFERTRELGLLRAVGMARSQLRSMVRWEAAIISVFGALLGTALGLFFGVSLTKALGDQGIRDVVVPIASLVNLVVIITLMGIAAALYPARRASRLDILAAVSSE